MTIQSFPYENLNKYLGLLKNSLTKQLLHRKVNLQGDYIDKLTKEKNALFTQNCEAATRHAGQMDAMQRKLEAATLGRGTCEMEYVSDFMSWHCKACGQMDMAPRNPKPWYCKWCGRKVVDPTTNDVDCPNCGRRVEE